MLRAVAAEHGPSANASPDPCALWERCVAHVGYAAEGVIYLLIGGFALLAAVGQQPQPNGSQGALAKLGATPLGLALLALLALGLGAFVFWELLVAFRDPEHRGDRHSARRRWARLGHFFNGIFHVVFVGEAIAGLLRLASNDDESRSTVRWTARAMAFPAGRAVVALTGAGIVLYGLWQFYRAATRNKNKRIDLRRARFPLALNALGVCGLAGRGILLTLVGIYVGSAAYHRDARYSGGIAGALGGLKARPGGEWLLGLLALGLIAYGAYQVIKERYRVLRDS